MTVTLQTPLTAATANGATTVFPFAFYVAASTDLVVQVTDTGGATTTKTLGADYTVSGVGVTAGGSVTFLVAPTNGYVVTIYRDTQLSRSTDYQNNGDLLAATVNTDFDRTWQALQDIYSGGKGSPTSLRVPNGETVSALPAASARASRILAFDGSGNPSLIVGVDAGSAAALAVDLATTNSSSKGAGQVGFNYALNYVAGTVGAALQDDFVNVMWFLSESQIADVRSYAATIDITTQMQAAHTFANGRSVKYPGGKYRFTTMTMTAGGIIGEGLTQTILYSTDVTGADLITYTGALGSYSNISTFRDFTVQATYPTKTTGAGIKFQPSSGEASYMYFSNVGFVATPIGIDFVKASLWKVTGCSFLSCGVAGIQVQNTNVADSGDSLIMGCEFSNPYATGDGILHKSSGGLRVIGNKVQGGNYGYRLAYDSAVGQTGLLIIQGNSFEDSTTGGIYLSRATGAQTWLGGIIAGNQFGGLFDNITTDTSSFLVDMVITGNKIVPKGGGTAYGIRLRNVTNFLVDGNFVRATGGTSTGIEVTNSTSVRVGKNYYQDCTNALTQSGNTGFHNHIDSQSSSSTTSAAGWGALGSLFLGPATNVTFPLPFLVTPAATDLTLAPGSNNGVCGGFITAISTTGFTYQALSSITGIAATIYWKCEGIL